MSSAVRTSVREEIMIGDRARIDINRHLPQVDRGSWHLTMLYVLTGMLLTLLLFVKYSNTIESYELYRGDVGEGDVLIRYPKTVIMYMPFTVEIHQYNKTMDNVHLIPIQSNCFVHRTSASGNVITFDVTCNYTELDHILLYICGRHSYFGYRGCLDILYVITIEDILYFPIPPHLFYTTLQIWKYMFLVALIIPAIMPLFFILPDEIKRGIIRWMS